MIRSSLTVYDYTRFTLVGQTKSGRPPSRDCEGFLCNRLLLESPVRSEKEDLWPTKRSSNAVKPKIRISA